MDLYQVCSNYSPWAKNGPTRGHMFYIGLYREQHEKIFLSETTRHKSLEIWYKASSGEPLPSLFKLDPWGQKWPHPGCHMLYIGLNREKHEKIFLSETIRPRAIYLVCSITLWIMPRGPKMVLGVTYFTLAYIGKNIEKSSCLKSLALEP